MSSDCNKIQHMHFLSKLTNQLHLNLYYIWTKLQFFFVLLRNKFS